MQYKYPPYRLGTHVGYTVTDFFMIFIFILKILEKFEF